MNATAIREAARVAALIAILAVAAVLGLAVGNAINGQSSGQVGAPAPAPAPAAAELSDYFQRHDLNAATRVAPKQTDPRPHIWAVIEDDGSDEAHLRRQVPR